MQDVDYDIFMIYSDIERPIDDLIQGRSVGSQGQ